MKSKAVEISIEVNTKYYSQLPVIKRSTESKTHFESFKADLSIKRSMRIYENSPMKDFRNNFEDFKRSSKQPESANTDLKSFKDKNRASKFLYFMKQNTIYQCAIQLKIN